MALRVQSALQFHHVLVLLWVDVLIGEINCQVLDFEFHDVWDSIRNGDLVAESENRVGSKRGPQGLVGQLYHVTRSIS